MTPTRAVREAPEALVYQAAEFEGTTKRTSGALFLFLIATVLWLQPCPAAGVEFFVGIDHPNASDTNNGLSSDHPFRTLARGTQGLWPGDTLTIMAGAYREVVQLPRSGTATAPITVRAYPGDEGRVAIRGSDIVTGWINEGNNTWSVDRPALPLMAYPDDWPDYGALSKRREMVFIDGNPLTQVLSAGELSEGRFWVDVSAGRYYVSSSGNLDDRLVEVATRDRGICAYWIDHVVWVGVKVEHVANGTDPAMFVRSFHEIRNCQVNNNNMEGIKAGDGAIILNSHVNRNGGVGINLPGSGCLLDGNETSHNSWRYGPGWHAGGIKVIYDRPADNRISRHTSNYNNGPGIWLDTCGPGNVVEASFMEGNKAVGLFIEATQGPTWAINNVVVGTELTDTPYPQCEGSGITTREAYDVFLYNNTVANVEGPGICISGDERNGGLDYTANTHVYNNIVVDSGSAAVRFWVWGTAREEPRISSHHFDNNLYYGQVTTIIFPHLVYPWPDQFWSLSEWQAAWFKDLQSLSLPPNFVNPGTNNFSLSPDSPAVDAGDDLADVSDDFAGCRRPKGATSDIGAFEYCVDAGNPPGEFTDGFEFGDTSMWSSAVP